MRADDNSLDAANAHKARVQRTVAGAALMLAGAAVMVWRPALATELGIPLLTVGAWVIEPSLVKRWVLRK